ncbi:hypothetical protein V1478_012801 [Vespula squamosa]|uniref:Uncharacterized protein n=1 Tax=Vespula squamosa TaxID=30214 RepID=A0ABD2A8Z5_VESSQ
MCQNSNYKVMVYKLKIRYSNEIRSRKTNDINKLNNKLNASYYKRLSRIHISRVNFRNPLNTGACYHDRKPITVPDRISDISQNHITLNHAIM